MKLQFAALCAALLLALPLEAASTYPTKPIRLIVPYPPGAGTDIIARTVGQKLGETLGQQVVVDNRGGGAGTDASSEQGSRLRDVNVRESEVAPWF